MRTNPYAMGLDKNDANFVALSPLSFIERTAAVYPDRTAIVYGTARQSWRQTYERCRRLASALAQRDVGVGDTVAAMLPNVPALFECHFGVPMTGAVLNTLNTRLDAEAIAFMLEHGQAKVLLIDREFATVVEKALALLGERRPLVIEVEDAQAPAGAHLSDISYEALLAEGAADFSRRVVHRRTCTRLVEGNRRHDRFGRRTLNDGNKGSGTSQRIRPEARHGELNRR